MKSVLKKIIVDRIRQNRSDASDCAKGVGSGANYIIGKRIRDLYNRVIVSGVFFDAATGPEALASPSPEGYFQTQVRVTFEFIEEL